jgi:hypothetical protein
MDLEGKEMNTDRGDAYLAFASRCTHLLVPYKNHYYHLKWYGVREKSPKKTTALGFEHRTSRMLSKLSTRWATATDSSVLV